MGSVKDIQAHLWHARVNTTVNEYMQELPSSVQEMVGSVYLRLANSGTQDASLEIATKVQQAIAPKQR